MKIGERSENEDTTSTKDVRALCKASDHGTHGSELELYSPLSFGGK